MIGCKWIFKKNEGIPRVKEPRLNGRLVEKSFTQVDGINYNEIFSLMVKHYSIRVILTILNKYNL